MNCSHSGEGKGFCRESRPPLLCFGSKTGNTSALISWQTRKLGCRPLSHRPQVNPSSMTVCACSPLFLQRTHRAASLFRRLQFLLRTGVPLARARSGDRRGTAGTAGHHGHSEQCHCRRRVASWGRWKPVSPGTVLATPAFVPEQKSCNKAATIPSGVPV